jgi:hypothetical protein
MIEPTETPHVHHGRHEDRHRWLDIGLAVAVVLVSLGSLYVSLHTGRTMEQLVEQNSRLVRANSVPLLQFDAGNINDKGQPEIYLAVRNAGTGPARIVWFELLQDGKPVHNVRELLPKDFKLDQPHGTIITGGIAPSMMPAGEQRKLLTWAEPRESAALPAWSHINKVRNDLKVEACYCSLFDECWLTNASADVPRPVATCEIGNRTTWQG